MLCIRLLVLYRKITPAVRLGRLAKEARNIDACALARRMNGKRKIRSLEMSMSGHVMGFAYMTVVDATEKTMQGLITITVVEKNRDAH